MNTNQYGILHRKFRFGAHLKCLYHKQHLLGLLISTWIGYVVELYLLFIFYSYLVRSFGVCFFLFYFMSFLMFVIISIQLKFPEYLHKRISVDSAKYRVRPHSHLHIWYNVCVSVWLGIRSMAYGKCLSGTLYDWYVHRRYDCFQFIISNGSNTLSIDFRSVMGNL